MTLARLVFRSAAYYWRTNIAVLLGVATAVAVLSGALLVGDSVRGSLRTIVLDRLGRTDRAIIASVFFTERLVEELRNDGDFHGEIAPLIVAQGFVTVQGSGARAGKVLIYGVDERFWSFHGVTLNPPTGREVLLSPALSKDLQLNPGDSILVRTQRPSDIPLESLHGRKEDATGTIRATMREVLSKENLGDFSLQAQQGDVRSVFLPLSLVQRDLDVGAKINVALLSGPEDIPIEPLLRKHVTLADLGLSLRGLKNGAIALESDSLVLDELRTSTAIAIADEMKLNSQPLFTYLANSLRIGDREVPYSLITAMDIGVSPDSIVLTEWAAQDLKAKPGDALSMDYFVWEEPGRLITRTAEFQVERIVPTEFGDPEMAASYPGITDAKSLSDWDSPFPIDLRRVRPIDEEFWKKHSTTPKAFIALGKGQALWNTRYGAVTSIRMSPAANADLEATKTEFEERLRGRLDPQHAGIVIQDIRTQSLGASRGATNFGEYFVYFSFFLVVSALLLTALFFKLNVEQRIQQIGLLRAVGTGPSTVRAIYLLEGLILSLAGAALGAAGAVAYAAGILAALRSWWVGAIGTQNITLHVSPLSLAAGAIGGVLAALFCIALTLRGLRRVPERALLAGQLQPGVAEIHSSPKMRKLGVLMASAGVALLLSGSIGALGQTAAFFGGGVALLVATLLWIRSHLVQPSQTVIGSGNLPMLQMGIRNASFRPTRSVVAIATIAAATFILISVNSFRKGTPEEGFGGYNVIAESLVPVVHDPNDEEGREALGLTDLATARFEPFRVRPGDDVSCLNLYEPRNPRILAPRDEFLKTARFRFQSSLASTAQENANPWLLLQRQETDGAIPVIADANSMTYVLHRKLGEDVILDDNGQEIRLRFVAALSDSIFQSELIMSQENFLKLFPEQEGYSMFLIETPADAVNQTISAVENALGSYGVDATASAARLAEFHRVENTYLSTFQMLGALGLLLGTVGLGAVLLRNILERRRELALLRTLGYGRAQFLTMTLVENGLLLVGGLLTGALCAFLAIAPTALSQGGSFPGVALAILLGVLLLLGLGISMLATRIALREAVLTALRSE